MDLHFATTSAATANADLLGIVIDDPNNLDAATRELDAALSGAISRELAHDTLSRTSAGSAMVTGAASGPDRILLLSLGSAPDGRADALRVAGSTLASTARTLKASHIGLVSPAQGATDAAYLTEGFILGAFRIHKYRGTAGTDGDDVTDRYEGPSQLTVLGLESGDDEHVVRDASTAAHATNWARDLANAPANLLTPALLADEAVALAARHEHLTCGVMNRVQIEELGMGLLSAVAQGSHDEPRVIVLEWNPPAAADQPNDARLALVGKAVTFDTGGISIKPSGGMEDMKLDKSGGCAVVGAMRAIADLKVPHRVLAVVGATMNMPDGNAYRPGDVVTSLDGTTVEIISTDAEGRLVLADCITHARSLGCSGIVELSTLTGAMVVALGHRYTGMIANESPLADAVLTAGKETGDYAWHLPMHDEYKAEMKTPCADLRNGGGRAGSALSAGAFLGHFAGDTPFVHLDVAGSAMLPKARAWYGSKGASGWGVRLLTRLAADYSA